MTDLAPDRPAMIQSAQLAQAAVSPVRGRLSEVSHAVCDHDYSDGGGGRAAPGFQVGQRRQGGGDPGDAVERELGERPVPFGDQTQEPGRLGRLPRVRRGPRPPAGERGGRLARRVLVAGQGPECEVTGLVGMLYIGNGEIRQEVSIVLTARAAGANRRLGWAERGLSGSGVYRTGWFDSRHPLRTQ